MHSECLKTRLYPSGMRFRKQRKTSVTRLFTTKNYFMAQNEWTSHLDILLEMKPSVKERK